MTTKWKMCAKIGGDAAPWAVFTSVKFSMEAKFGSRRAPPNDDKDGT